MSHWASGSATPVCANLRVRSWHNGGREGQTGQEASEGAARLTSRPGSLEAAFLCLCPLFGPQEAVLRGTHFMCSAAVFRSRLPEFRSTYLLESLVAIIFLPPNSDVCFNNLKGHLR